MGISICDIASKKYQHTFSVCNIYHNELFWDGDRRERSKRSWRQHFIKRGVLCVILYIDEL